MKTTVNHHENERGMALITALMTMTMLLALGAALVFSATTDTTTTKVRRSGEQAFFIADAGIGIARRSLAQAFTEELDKLRSGQIPFFSLPDVIPGVFPDLQLMPEPDQVADALVYRDIYARAKQLAEQDSARNQKFDQLNGGSFTTSFKITTGTISLVKQDATHATQVMLFRYEIQVKGKTKAGGAAQINEVGRLSLNVNLQIGAAIGTPQKNFSFSGFSVFFDEGDPNGGSWFLPPGTYSGTVHTNSNFAFYNGWQYNFRNLVSQTHPKIRYMDSSLNPNNWIAMPSGNISGITLSSEGYHKTDTVPLPANSYSQEYAVINGTGVRDLNLLGSPVDPPPVIPKTLLGLDVPVFDINGRVTPQVLAANLRNISNQTPTLSNGQLPNGIYISSANGTNLTGAGIYVQGDADDMQLYADTNGDQLFVIKQGGTTATIRVDYSNIRTKMTVGNNTYTYTGVPLDKSDALNSRPGVSLYVNGSINSLRGGKDNNASLNRPAIAANTTLTVTAARHMTIKGDLKYTDPVVNSDGTPVANIAAVKNVLGLFTNDGNIYLDAKPQYTASGLNLEIDAAVCAFDSNTANNNNKTEGGLTSYVDSSGHQTPDDNDRIRLVGSDVEKRNSAADYVSGDTYFDVRFSGGIFRPPFYPSTTYSTGQAPPASLLAIVNIDMPATSAMSWFVDNN